MSDLFFIEKILIDRRAKRDALAHRVERIYFPELEGQAKFHENAANELRSMLYSRFISEELSQYALRRDRHLYQRRTFGWSYWVNGFRSISLVSLPKRVAMLSNRISQLWKQLESKGAASSLELDKLNTKRIYHESCQEYHMVQLCVNKADKIRQEYAAKTDDIYLEIDMLLGQIIKLLEIEDKQLILIRSRHWRRVRRYCATACQVDPTLGPEYTHEDLMSQIEEMKTLGEYQPVLEDAYRRQKRIKNDQEVIRTWR